MEGLDDIIDLSDGENAPALWGLSQKPKIKSSRYATLQPYNDRVLGDDDASDNQKAFMNHDCENALKPNSDEDDISSLPGHTRYIKYDDDEFLPDAFSTREADAVKSENHADCHPDRANGNFIDNGKTGTNAALGNDFDVIEDGKFRFDDFRFDDDMDFNFDDPIAEAAGSLNDGSDCVPSVSPRNDVCDDDVGHDARPEYSKTLSGMMDDGPTLAADRKEASFGRYGTREINAMWDSVTRKSRGSKFGFNKLLASAASEDWKVGDDDKEKEEDQFPDAREWSDDDGLDACDLDDERGAGDERDSVLKEQYDFAPDGRVLNGVDNRAMRKPYDSAQCERRPTQEYDGANIKDDNETRHHDSSFAVEEEQKCGVKTRIDETTTKTELFSCSNGNLQRPTTKRPTEEHARSETRAVESGHELPDRDCTRADDHQTSRDANAEPLSDDGVASVKNGSRSGYEAECELVEDHDYAAAIDARIISETKKETPIKSQGQYHFDDIPIKSAGQYNFDDLPIKSAGQYKFDDIAKDDIANSDKVYDVEEQQVPLRKATPTTVDDALTRTFTRDACKDATDDAHFHAASRTDAIASELHSKQKNARAFPMSSPSVTRSEAATTVGDADTTTSPGTTSTVLTAGTQEVVKRPFLRKGTRTASTLRAKGGKPTSFPAPKQTGATLTLTKAHDGGGDKTGLPDPATPSTSSALPLSQHTAPGNSYKNTFNARAVSHKTKTPAKPKRRPQDAMWDDNSGDDSVEDDDKQSFMDFMRDKGLTVPEFNRMAARTQQQPKKDDATVKTPHFRGAFNSSSLNSSTMKDADEKNAMSSNKPSSTLGTSGKKGFREYYYEKFGSPDGNFAGLRDAVGNEERNEKRAFRDLYHVDGVGTATSSSDTRGTRAPGTAPAAARKKEPTSYASLWEEEMGKKSGHRQWDDPWCADEDIDQQPDVEVFDKDSAPVSNLVRKHFYKGEPPKEKTIPEPPSEEVDEDMRALLQQKLTLLDAQIARFKKENEQCKKLRLEREQALRDAEKDREKMQAELNSEREKMRAELEEDQEKLRRERKRIEQDRERHRQQLAQSRADQEEMTTLRQQVLDMKEEHAQKEQRWRRTVERLQKQNDDLKKKNQEVNDEIAWAHKRNTGAQPPASRRAASVSSVIKSPKDNPNPSQNAAEKLVRPSVPAKGAFGPSTGLGAAPSKPEAKVSRQQKAPDNRVERVLPDGSREIEFPNGLKKVLYPDGSCSVLFANGDTKECKKDGSVVYRYHGTQAKQTTMPDGTELYEFSSGQSEVHYPDGSKQISFPNGTTKKIAADGTENISFVNGTTKTIAA